MKAVRDSAYDVEVAMAKPVYDKLLKLFLSTPGTIANLMSILSTKFAISISEPAARRLLVRMQWHNELSMEFVPTAYRPLVHDDGVFEWPMQFGVSSWTICSTCGRRQPRKQNAAIGVQFECPKTIVAICKAEDFPTGCCFDCYRQRDLETNGAHPAQPKHELLSTLEWKRRHRRLWNLAETPSHYPTVSSYAQPQREDWPVYDPNAGVYVEWSPETKHLESMLELSDRAVLQLRCIDLFQKHAQERGKSKAGPTCNRKKLYTTRGRWEDQLAEHRCTSAKAEAAR